jgi:DNA-nicking Smr family endonuclease
MAKSKLHLIKKQRQRNTPSLAPLASASLAEHTDLLTALYAQVKPLAATEIYQHPRPRPRPYPRPRTDFYTDQLEQNEIVEPNFIKTNEGFYRPGQRRDILKRMRRQDWLVQHTLDLHGLSKAQAEAATQRFLATCLQAGLQRLRIIHGKGLSSPNQEPIVKNSILHWLTYQSVVLAFTHPTAAQGGTGAVLVLIKKQAS